MRYVAFLRGVNVNGRKILKDELLACFTGVGFDEVKTVAQTGNVVFEASHTDAVNLRIKIEHALSNYFSMDIIVLLFPIQTIQQVINAYPFTVSDDRHAYVVLTDGNVSSMLTAWTGSEVDQVAATSVGFYWSVPKGMTLDSPFAKFLANKTISSHTTTRNINTLGKVVEAAG